MKNVIDNGKEVAVIELISLLDEDVNKRGSSGKERMLSVKVNGGFFGYITSARLDGWADGLITDVCLELRTDYEESD